MLVRPGGRRVDCWCVRVAEPGELPAGDRVAHLLLALREDEAGFATVANRNFSGSLAARSQAAAARALAGPALDGPAGWRGQRADGWTAARFSAARCACWSARRSSAARAFSSGWRCFVLLARELSDTEALIGLPVAVAVRRLGRGGATDGRLDAALGAADAAGDRAALRGGRRGGDPAGGAGGQLPPALRRGPPPSASANTSNLLARYAASDLAAPDRRAKAISAVLLASAAGAILGPNLAEPAGGLGDVLGVSEKAAPFAISVVLLSAVRGGDC